MHKYLRAIGFSKIKKMSELRKVLNMCLKDPTRREYVSLSIDGIAAEYQKDFGENIGIAVCGEFTEDVDFDYEYYYPYMRGTKTNTFEDVVVEENSDKESYAGICDEIRLGVSLIFCLQNRMEYLKHLNNSTLPDDLVKIRMAGLSVSGTIMLPLKKTPDEMRTSKKAEKKRNHLIEAAFQGDENAMESLTMEDYDTYSELYRRIHTDDVFTLVDTYFMPYGIECDKYSVLGEIVEIKQIKNYLTSEEIYVITINCNDLLFDICINREDLVGEPAVHRRFRGVVWMQGHIEFS